MKRLSLFAAAVALTLAACSSDDRLYRAEKDLFRADKYNSQLAASLIDERTEFVNRAMDAYRGIVSDYSDDIDRVAGMRDIVVTAQIQLAELEFRTGLLGDARRDFEAVPPMAVGIPEAQMNAVYSAAVISRFLSDEVRARELYSRFYDAYLDGPDASRTASSHARYLITPLTLAELEHDAGRETAGVMWLKRAEELYEQLDNGDDMPYTKVARFNLVTATVQQRKWERALELVRRYQGLYPSPDDQSALRFIEGKILQTGIGDEEQAQRVYEEVYALYPTSAEAPIAMLSVAATLVSAGRLDEAADQYELIARAYRIRENAASEAEWRLAEIGTARDDWGATSLRYKSITSKYPGTYYAFEAQLRLAEGYGVRDQSKQMATAYQNALRKYEEVVSGQYAIATRVMAEDYILQVYSAQQRWEDAVQQLLTTAVEYPGFAKLQHNYITAARIYERELHDRDKAVATLQLCVERLPDSDAAAAAAVELRRLNGGR